MLSCRDRCCCWPRAAARRGLLRPVVWSRLAASLPAELDFLLAALDASLLQPAWPNWLQAPSRDELQRHAQRLSRACWSRWECA